MDRRAPRFLGLAATFSGVALVAHITMDASLPLALLGFGTLLGFAVAILWSRAAPGRRKWMAHTARAGALGGAAAVLAYDASKWALARIDPSPFNPFEAIPLFGRLFLGTSGGSTAVVVAGTAYHALNGIFFGVAFAFLFRRPGIGRGIAWGLFLEAFQLTLYPGWLDSGFYAEFVRISAMSHVVYGATLGDVTRRYLVGTRPGEALP